MTTPAVNYTIYTPRSGLRTETRYYSDGRPPSVVNIVSTVSGKMERRKRPASTTIGIDPKNWRNCGGWSHTGATVSCSGGDPKFIKGIAPNHYTLQWTGSSYWGVIDPIPAWNPKYLDRALVKALNKLKDQDIHLGNFLVEIKQTGRLLVDTIHRIRKTVETYKRLDKLTGGQKWKYVKKYATGGWDKRRWRKIPQSWLEVQYGWNPLLSDILGALAALQKTAREVGALFHVTGSSKDEYADVLRVNGANGSYRDLDQEFEIKAVASLWFELVNGTIADLSSLGLLNPAEACWEALRYSFIVDWFLPIGPWMSSLTAGAGFAFKGGSGSTISKVRVSNRREHYEHPYGYNFVEASGHNYSAQAFRFERVCYTTTPIPGLHFKNPISGLHIANAIALLSLTFLKD